MTAAIYNESNPAGFDYQILEIQKYLGCLSFIEAIFGVARLQVENNEGKDRVYPQGRKIGGDVDLTPDDTYISRIFFLMKDTVDSNIKQDDWDWTADNVELKQNFSLYFFCNMTKIANAGIALTTTEQIKTALLFALNKVPKLKVNTLSENIDNVWKGFTSTNEINGFGRYPNYCLKIDATLHYYAFPMNGSTLSYNPASQFDISKLNTITPNTQTGHANVN